MENNMQNNLTKWLFINALEKKIKILDITHKQHSQRLETMNNKLVVAALGRSTNSVNETTDMVNQMGKLLTDLHILLELVKTDKVVVFCTIDFINNCHLKVSWDDVKPAMDIEAFNRVSTITIEAITSEMFHYSSLNPLFQSK